MRRLDLIDHARQDLRFAWRQLRRHPLFAATAVSMLALGLCANVAIFGFVDAALIRPLPYADQDRLVGVYHAGRTFVSYVNFTDFRALNQGFRSIDAFDVRGGVTWTTPAGVRERVRALKVTAGFFRTLGVTPILGRDFRADEEGPAAAPTAMLAYGAWQTRFGGTPDIVGQMLTFNGEPHLVIGVLPRGFHFTLAERADVFTTIRGGDPCRSRRVCQSMIAIARLADGVSIEGGAANLESVMAQLRQQYPGDNTGKTTIVVPLRAVMMGDVRPILLVLLSGAGLLLSIACLNVISLLLAHSHSRAREIAVRDALGASSTRLLLQFTTEALVLVAAGTIAGLTLAAWGIPLLTSLLSARMLERVPYLEGLHLNARLVAFACVIASIAVVIFTLTPAVRLRRSARAAGLKEGSRGSAGTAWRRVGAPLVVAELALAVILLVGAGLLGKSLYRLLHVDIGFDADRLATLSVSRAPTASATAAPSGATAPTPAAPASASSGPVAPPPADLTFARDIAARIAAVPGVQAVGYADQLPLSPGDGAPSSNLQRPGRPYPDEQRKSHPVRRVGPGYFAALGATMTRGREFTEAEIASGRRIAIINDTAARWYFPGENPIGQDIIVGAPPARTIVGVVADIKDASLELPARPAAYVAWDQTTFALVVRTSQAGETIFPSLIAAIRDTRPDAFTYRPEMMSERIDQAPAAHLQRAMAWVVGFFATSAFILAVVGLYGVVAYSVGQRTREIGVRIALGAERRSVYGLVIGEAAWLVGIGTIVGIASAIGVATLMRRLLFGVESWDAPTVVVSAITLIGAALVASYLPARRAASVNPVEVLRTD